MPGIVALSSPSFQFLNAAQIYVKKQIELYDC